MLAASLFDHPGILLIIVAVTLVRWLIQKGKVTAQNTPPPAPPPSRPISRGGETQTEEERVRKFLEALGQPPGTTPPKVSPRRAVQPTVFPRLPQLKTVPPALPKKPASPPPLPVEIATLPPVNISGQDFQVHDVARQTSSEPAPAQRSAARFAGRIKLGTPQDLRTAIVLREIFGPPRSLQGFDSTGGL